MTLHMAIDRIEDQAELSRMQSSVLTEGFKNMPLPESRALEQVVGQLEDVCNEAVSGQSWTNPLARE